MFFKWINFASDVVITKPKFWVKIPSPIDILVNKTYFFSILVIEN